MNEEHGVNKNNLNLSWKLRLHGNSNLYIDHRWIPIAVFALYLNLGSNRKYNPS